MAERMRATNVAVDGDFGAAQAISGNAVNGCEAFGLMRLGPES